MDNDAFEELKAQAFKIYQVEVQDTMDSAEQLLLQLEESPTDTGLINAVFRDLHTIKGSSAMNGIDQVASFIHKLEDAYDQARNGELAVNAELIDVALKSLDYVRQLIDAQADVSKTDQAAAAAIQTRIDSLIGENVPVSAEIAAPAPSPQEAGVNNPEEAPNHTLYHVKFVPDANLMFRGTNVIGLLEEMLELGPCRLVTDVRQVPSLDEIKPDTIYTSWRILVAFAGDQELLDDVFMFVLDDCVVSIVPLIQEITYDKACQLVERLYLLLDTDPDVGIDRLEEAARALLDDGQKAESSMVVPGTKTSEFEERPSSGGEDASSFSTGQKLASDKKFIRVPAERLDVQLDLVGELVIAQAGLTQYSGMARDTRLDAIAEVIERLTDDLRDNTMNLRMLPVGNLFSRYKRVVRDMALRIGKQITLTTEGEETELDKTVIDQLGDPLVHLIRNSADHGLESASERIAAGKASTGTIKLSAAHVGSKVVITVSDDGRGLDLDAIRARAESNGLLTPLVSYSDNQVFKQIFQPGFTTVKKVSDMSGRGVGMDVVKRVIDKLQGTIEIHSQPGQGTQIGLQVPLTLAIIDGLLVDVGDNFFVLPLGLVEEVVELQQARGDSTTENNILNIRGAIVPYVFLREMLNINNRSDDIERVVIVSSGGERVGLVVDHIVGQHQTVIKGLGKAYENVSNFSGSTILGDGTVALILDVPDLLRYAEKYKGTQLPS
jgi:two-component system chemotaxis sensor kinase CheA